VSYCNPFIVSGISDLGNVSPVKSVTVLRLHNRPGSAFLLGSERKTWSETYVIVNPSSSCPISLVNGREASYIAPAKNTAMYIS
jgi:hypothetical protein